MADEKEEGAETVEETGATQEPKQDGSPKTYTAEELQAEADRRAQKAAETARKNALAEFEKRLEDEKKKAEADRLKEQGEYKTIAEQNQAELDALKSQLAEKERRETISGGLREAGLSEFETVLLADRSNPDDFVAAAKSLADLLKKQVDAEVEKRLETGRKVDAGSKPDSKSNGFTYPSMQKVG